MTQRRRRTQREASRGKSNWKPRLTVVFNPPVLASTTKLNAVEDIEGKASAEGSSEDSVDQGGIERRRSKSALVSRVSKRSSNSGAARSRTDLPR